MLLQYYITGLVATLRRNRSIIDAAGGSSAAPVRGLPDHAGVRAGELGSGPEPHRRLGPARPATAGHPARAVLGQAARHLPLHGGGAAPVAR